MINGLYSKAYTSGILQGVYAGTSPVQCFCQWPRGGYRRDVQQVCRMGETANRSAGRPAIHRDLEMPKAWTRGKLMKFIQRNCQELSLGRKYWCKNTGRFLLGWEQLCRKDPGGLLWLQRWPMIPWVIYPWMQPGNWRERLFPLLFGWIILPTAYYR